MIATLAAYALAGAVLLAVSIAIAHVLVRLLDPVIGYRPEHEDAHNPPPWPDDPPRHRRPPIAVGPGQPIAFQRRYRDRREELPEPAPPPRMRTPLR